MTKVLELLLKYIGYPLMMKAIESLTAWIKDIYDRKQADRQIDQEQTRQTEVMEDAKTPEEIRAAHRNRDSF